MTAGDASLPTDAGAASVVRSEERLVPGVERVAVRRVRLGKRQVTEEVTLTVEVTREEAVVEEEDLPTAGAMPDDVTPAAGSPVPEGASDGWVVLYEERPVVTMERVPVERVRLVVESTSEKAVVREQLRRDEVVVDDPLRGAAPAADYN